MSQHPVDLTALAWPVARLDEAIELLARRTGLGSVFHEAQSLPPELHQAGLAALGQWVQATADRLGLEAEPVAVSLAELDDLVHQTAPAILYLPPALNNPTASSLFLVLLAGRRQWLGPKAV
ncbi:MAG TPA: hypothetical protein P5526_11695, partial [Anaerolineae bacterium]|nr:hypothetical protein [Anaerolineae bacterium]